MIEKLYLKLKDQDVEKLRGVIRSGDFLLEHENVISYMDLILQGETTLIINHSEEYEIFDTLKDLEISYDIDFVV